MTYGLKRYGKWRTPYWRADEIKNRREIDSANSDEYSDLDAALFEAILREELDVPDYAVNEKNIKKEFFSYKEDGADIKAECLKQIVAYYRWRAALFKKICGQTLNNKAESLLKQTGADEIKFRYYIPAEYNNFSCEEAPYTGGQTEAYLEIAVRR